MATEIQQLAKVVEGPAKNLKIDLPAKAGEVKMLVTKDGTMSDAASCISSVDATSSAKENEAEQESVVSDQSMYYPVNGVYGYYYPEWDGQNYYGAESMESQRSVSQPDNGSVIYYFPGFQPDYTSYNSYLPGSTVNVDGQYLAQPIYYPSSPFSPTYLSPGLYPQSVGYGPEMVPAYSWDSYPIYTDGFYGNMEGDSTYSVPKPNFSSHTPSKTYPTKSDIADKKGSSITVDVSRSPASQSHHLKPSNKVPALSKGILPAKKLPQYDAYPIQGKLYPYNNTSFKESGRTWAGTEKPKARNKVHGYGDFDMQNEQNRGPRTNGGKSNFVSDPVGSFGIERNGSGIERNGSGNGTSNLVVRKEDYNLVEFPIKYENALFFVIKSYSEDDIHKSIKYNVWASTPNGNKRLDNAFQLAQEKMAEKGSKCPIFLFFSVNASGQFCGVAEMIGRVDFCKTMDFWQQDKWTGYFPVKWHIIKDVPNPQFRHVILENNENKPVTNSRDTQEVKFVQGTEILNIFKNYSSKTSILDDFGFYENRQKAMQQDRRIKDPALNVELLSLKADDKVEVQATGESAIVSGMASIETADEAKEELSTGNDEAKE